MSKLELVHAVVRLQDLRTPPGNRLEALRGDRTGQHSIRVNDQWRICFRWEGKEDEMTPDTYALPPMHPGEVLREEFLVPLGVSAYAVAKAIGLTPQHLAAIAREKRNISPDVALRLGRYLFGDADSGAQFWMNLQTSFDLAVALGERGGVIAAIRPHPRVAEANTEERAST